MPFSSRRKDVRIADVGHGNENLEWILLVRLSDPPLDFTFNLGFALLPVTICDLRMSKRGVVQVCARYLRREPEVLLVAP